MLRQLRRLTRPVPALGDDVVAIGVYAEPQGENLVDRAAAEQGFEGVACVDDTARAAVLACDVWQTQRQPWAAEMARGYLGFVAGMQDEGGMFVNFLLGWNGQKNLDGPTSRCGGWPWAARGLHALARGAAAFDDAKLAARFERALPFLDEPPPELDVQAVLVLALLEWWDATGASEGEERAVALAHGIAAHRIGDLLPNRPGETPTHLWGHLQEVALARVGARFGHPGLVEVARRSADHLLAPAVRSAFRDRPATVPFDVSCAVHGLTAVGEATADERYLELAELAREWFRGRNAARRRVYDRRRGLVYDGIDGARVSRNSGAEANIEGASALLASLPWSRYRPAVPETGLALI